MERKILLLFLVADVKTKNQELRTKLRTPENNLDNTRTKADDSPKPYKKPVLYHSCLELMNNGHNESGKYEIAPFPNSTKTFIVTKIPTVEDGLCFSEINTV